MNHLVVDIHVRAAEEMIHNFLLLPLRRNILDFQIRCHLLSFPSIFTLLLRNLKTDLNRSHETGLGRIIA